MTFKDFLTDIKAVTSTVAGLAVVVGILWAMYSHFYTDAEAAEHIKEFEGYQQQQYAADKFDRVDRVQREIDRIDYQLLDIDLPQHKREYLMNKRADLVKKIECIRRDEC